jgi:starvation-inducible DNA-binding protein
VNTRNETTRRTAASTARSHLSANAVQDISGALTTLLADVFALYLKTKNFHWHMSGPHFRDYHLLLDEHGEQIFAITDAIAERVRKAGGTTLHSIGQIARLQRVPDDDADYVTPLRYVGRAARRQQTAGSSYAADALPVRRMRRRCQRQLVRDLDR